jgi:hypothetical protein
LRHPVAGAFEAFVPYTPNPSLRNAPGTRDTALYLPFRTALEAGTQNIIELPDLIRAFMRHEIAVENQDSVRLTLLDYLRELCPEQFTFL